MIICTYKNISDIKKTKTKKKKKKKRKKEKVTQIFTKCPNKCENSTLIETDTMAEHCDKCGLIIATYTNPLGPAYKNKKPDHIKEIKHQKKVNKPQPQKKKVCKACGGTTNITLHHMIPKRTGIKGKKVLLCRTPCHNIADMIANVIYRNEVTIKEVKEQ